MGNSITFKQFLLDNLLKLEDYKLHLAAYNGEEHPLDVYYRNNGDWESWNEYRGGRDDFNRKKIFCLIPDYRNPGVYIFAGIYDITERFDDWAKTGKGYQVKISDELSDQIDLLKVRFDRYQGLRGRSFRLEGLSKLMTVVD